MKKVIISILLCGLLAVGCKSNDTTDKENSVDNEIKEEEIITEEEEPPVDEEDEINEKDTEEKVEYYISKLKDKNYIFSYGGEEEPNIWYTAAEELGTIGKPSIPSLIKNLETDDSYEKGLTLYALLLASQDERLREVTKGEYIEAGLTFDEKEQAEFTEAALNWWEKYKDQF